MSGSVIGAEHDTQTTGGGKDANHGTRLVPMLLTVDDAADLLRTTKRAVYAMIERRQLPGITRIGRRVLLRADDLLDWLDQKRAPSLRE
ncbi:MAG TPA: helix-turn-helix domain-containing protein [Vicinamibacterales bacterium]|nr:helix-turn-helix domain-containing protein [Vicinamibacterales bacterium]